MMTTRLDSDQITHPLDVARQAALVGAGSAIPGCIIGATYGTLRTETPILFSLVSGLQWFAIGTTFWGIRSTLLSQPSLSNWWNLTRGKPHLAQQHTLEHTPKDRVRASAISGALTGASLGLLFRGPRNVVPGTIMFTLFGWTGQHAYNYLDQRNSDTVRRESEMKEQGVQKPTLMQRVAKSKWSPMSVLTDEEYKEIMNEKVLSVEAEIALIDEKIEGLRKLQLQQKAEALVSKVESQGSK